MFGMKWAYLAPPSPSLHLCSLLGLQFTRPFIFIVYVTVTATL